MPIEEAIIELLRSHGPCHLDNVVTHLPAFSWGEVFLAIDRMSRDGRVVLSQLGYSTYKLALRSQFLESGSTSRQEKPTTGDAMTIPPAAA